MNVQKALAVQLSVQLAVKNSDVRKSLAKIISEINGLILHDNQDSSRVDILVLEIGVNPAAEFETIRALLKENMVGNLFLTSSKTTTDILLPALRAGAREFFPQPVDPMEVRTAFEKIVSQNQQRTREESEPQRQGKLFSVLGAKGGVGTTTFAVNFSTSIQACDKNKRIALIDMNRLVGEIPLFLDLKTDTNWEEIGKNLSRLDAAYLQSAMAKHSSGVYVLPAPGKIDREIHLPEGFLHNLIVIMRKYFDYVIIDAGIYLDDTLGRIIKESERIYLVSILSLPCIINVRKLQNTVFAAAGVTNGKLQIVANRFEKKAQVSLAEANRIIGTEIAATIPNNYQLTMEAINNGKTIAEISKGSDLAKVYSRLADSAAERGLEKSSGIFNWFR